MQQKRPVIAGLRSFNIKGAIYQVPLYVHRRLGSRDGWCVNITGVQHFFADEDTDTAQALTEATVFLASILRYDLPALRSAAPIFIRVTPACQGVSDIVGYFKNRHDINQEHFIARIKNDNGLTLTTEYKLQELPVWLGHLDYSSILTWWTEEFRASLSHVFWPNDYRDLIQKTKSSAQIQMTLAI